MSHRTRGSGITNCHPSLVCSISRHSAIGPPLGGSTAPCPSVAPGARPGTSQIRGPPASCTTTLLHGGSAQGYVAMERKPRQILFSAVLCEYSGAALKPSQQSMAFPRAYGARMAELAVSQRELAERNRMVHGSGWLIRAGGRGFNIQREGGGGGMAQVMATGGKSGKHPTFASHEFQ